MLKKFSVPFLFFFTTFIIPAKAQIKIGDDSSAVDYSNPKEYEIAGITVTGVKYLDENALKILSGLSVGEKVKVPGDKFSKAIENLWKQGTPPLI
jgi:outer membrane protein insertion porin family